MRTGRAGVRDGRRRLRAVARAADGRGGAPGARPAGRPADAPGAARERGRSGRRHGRRAGRCRQGAADARGDRRVAGRRGGAGRGDRLEAARHRDAARPDRHLQHRRRVALPGLTHLYCGASATMRIAILDPAAGISGDMTLGALLSLGAPAAWLEALPRRLGGGLEEVGVTIREVTRSGVACTQVEFAIPEQPHGRHVGELVRLVERAPLSDWVKQRAVRAFRLIGEAEGRVHGVAPEQVHLHEVGAVDAVLDIVGGIEGFEQLGVEGIYNWPVAVGTGWVEAAHGRLPVPAPATAILLEGVAVATGGPVEGEATTPTGPPVAAGPLGGTTAGAVAPRQGRLGCGAARPAALSQRAPDSPR